MLAEFGGRWRRALNLRVAAILREDGCGAGLSSGWDLFVLIRLSDYRLLLELRYHLEQSAYLKSLSCLPPRLVKKMLVRKGY
jgi:hypothetical protein